MAHRAQFLVLDALMGLTFIGAGAIAWLRRPEVLTGQLLVLCGALNFVGSYGPTELPVVSHLAFAFQGWYDLVLADPRAGAARTLATRRRCLGRLGHGCRLRGPKRDPVVPPGPGDVPGRVPGLPPEPVRDLPRSGPVRAAGEPRPRLAIAALALTVAGVCVWRLVRARPLARRVLWPILVAGAAVMLIAAFDAAETASSPLTGTPLLAVEPPADELVSWALFLTRLLVPIGLLIGSLRLRRAGGPLVALAVGLGRVPSPVRLQSALGAALGDPGVRLVRRDPDGRAG